MRESGYYWVRFLGCNWQAHYWSGQIWLLGRHHFHDNDLSDIDERRIVREVE